jgi:hypothetical protein
MMRRRVLDACRLTLDQRWSLVESKDYVSYSAISAKLASSVGPPSFGALAHTPRGRQREALQRSDPNQNGHDSFLVIFNTPPVWFPPNDGRDPVLF